MTEPLLMPSEVADWLRTSTSSVYRDARLGLIPSVRIGRKVRFEREAILSFIRGPGSRAHSPVVPATSPRDFGSSPLVDEKTRREFYGRRTRAKKTG